MGKNMNVINESSSAIDAFHHQDLNEMKKSIIETEKDIGRTTEHIMMSMRSVQDIINDKESFLEREHLNKQLAMIEEDIVVTNEHILNEKQTLLKEKDRLE